MFRQEFEIHQDHISGQRWTLKRAWLVEDFPDIVKLLFGDDTENIVEDVNDLHENYTYLINEGMLDLFILSRNEVPITLMEVLTDTQPMAKPDPARHKQIQLYYVPDHQPFQDLSPYINLVNWLLDKIHTVYLSADCYDHELIAMAKNIGFTEHLTISIAFIPKLILIKSRQEEN